MTDPDSTNAKVPEKTIAEWFLQALTLEKEGKPTEAIDYYRRILEQDQRHLGSWNNLALLLDKKALIAEAEQCCFDGLLHCPEADAIYNTLGQIKLRQGYADQALADFYHAVELHQDNLISGSNLLLSMNYLDLPPEEMLAEHQQWAMRCQNCSRIPLETEITPAPILSGRKLRVGYVSAEFRRHSVAFFLESLLHFHNRNRFEIHLFSDVKNPDYVTERMRLDADCWHDLASMDNLAAATCIRKQQMDVLVDLSGHTGIRMEVFARRAAPVQVTWLGYPNTTGLSNMDWRLTDDLADAPEYDRYYAERQWRLPGGMWAYSPPENIPEPTPPPCLERGCITFGSFNHIAKVSVAGLKMWAAALRAVPNSRLVIKNSAMSDPTVAADLRDRLINVGIAGSRIETRPFTPNLNQHLQEYNDIDIALDSWPYNGTTTTFESLWMGVPVLTVSGENHASRTGSAILRRLGLDMLVAENPDVLARKAAALAHPVPLTALRKNLRPMLTSSSLCDGRRLALEIEECFYNICRWS